MHFSLVVTISLLGVFAVAVPKPVVKPNGIAMKLTQRASLPNPDNTVDINVLNAHVASHTDKILRSFDNYKRNTGTTHPYAVNGIGVRERAIGAGTGTPLMSDKALIWYGELSIGTPPQTFTVEINTGSSDMFVPYYLCDDSCAGHTLWDSDESSSSEMLMTGFYMTYSDGSAVRGLLYVDNVTISGFTADKQTFGAAITYSTQFHEDYWAPDGMLGMAFQSISAYPAKPLFTTFADEKVTAPTFSLKLTYDGGELYVGGVNPDLYKGDFTYTPVTVQAHWQVNIQSIQDGKGNRPLTNIPAIIDTGTDFIIGDPIRVSRMYNAMGGSTYIGDGFYSFPCNSFPTISFRFGGKSFKIPPELLKLGRVSPGSDECFSSIIAKNTGASFWSIGNAFIQGYYTTFDLGQNGRDPRVGFAELQ